MHIGSGVDYTHLEQVGCAIVSAVSALAPSIHCHHYAPNRAIPSNGREQKYYEKESDLGQVERLQPLLLQCDVKSVMDYVDKNNRHRKDDSRSWLDEKQQCRQRVKKRKRPPENTASQVSAGAVSVIPEQSMRDVCTDVISGCNEKAAREQNSDGE
ncbi:hypothetical protein [Pseudomonas sp. A-RE-19]|uniref:hypothetical protein n=1 Tax=Pseudomonas sp. A-RE-19 TaxID=2832401 RepID=UPI001CBBA689|nr:hypothetical protein [Pseudomonas sp. A-RE-19]